MKNSLRILQNASETEKERSIRTWPIFYVTITHMLGRVLGARFWGSGVKKWRCNTHTSHQQRTRHQSRFHLSLTPSSHLSSVVLPKHPTKEPNSREDHKTWEEKDCRYSDGLGDLLVSFHFHSNHSLFTPLQPALQSWNCRWARTRPLSRGALKSWNCPWARTWPYQTSP